MGVRDFQEVGRFCQEALKCINCGLCQGVCPVYKTTGEEGTSARGKVNLIKSLLQGELQPSKVSTRLFYLCLLCYACRDACPAGVNTERLWITAREDMAQELGLPLLKRLIFRGFLGKPRIYNSSPRVAALGQRILGRRVDGLLRVWPPFSKILKGKEFLPLLSFTPLLKQLPEVIPPVDKTRMRVGFYLGCLTNFITQQIGRSLINVLTKMGVEVVVPKEQLCCGAPPFNNGDFRTARQLARRNIQAFEKVSVDWIVTGCATCGSAFKIEYEILLRDDPKLKKSYPEFKAKVKDISEFLVDVLGLSGIKMKGKPRRVAYHDSCHLYHTQKIIDQPREIISSIPGVKLVEMTDMDRCCGFGGSFSLMFPGLSSHISEYKLTRILETDPEVVIAGSPGCILQIREKIHQQGLNLPVKHTIEFLEENMEG